MQSLFSAKKLAISLKQAKVGPRLLLTATMKLHTRFQLVPKSMILDDLERSILTRLYNKVFFEAYHEDIPIISAAKMLSNDSSF